MTSSAPDGGDMERRVSLLEKSFEKLDAKIDRLIESNDARFERLAASMDAKFDRLIESNNGMNVRLARIEELLDTKASATEVADLRGTVSVLPNIWQLITVVFGTLAGAFAIVRFGLPHP